MLGELGVADTYATDAEPDIRSRRLLLVLAFPSAKKT